MRWLVALAILLGATTRAGADPEAIRISYQAPATGCPDEDHVAAQLLDRSGATRTDAIGARAFRLAIAPPGDDGGFRGTLEVVADDGTITTRAVSSRSCRETVAALVLVAALAIEEAAGAAVVPLVGPAIPALPPAPPPPPPPLPMAVVAISSPAWAIAAEVGFARYGGMSPDAQLGVPIAVVARRGARRLRLVFDATQRDADATTRTTFRWTAGRLEGCPIAFGLALAAAGARLELAPCLGFQAGILDARGTARPAGGARPWLAPEALARLGVARGRVALGLAGGVVVPLVRDRYLDVTNTLYRVPAVASLVEIDLRDHDLVIDVPGCGHSMNGEDGMGIQATPLVSETASTSIARGSKPGAADPAVATARLRALFDGEFDFVWRSLRRLGVPPLTVDDAAQEVFIVAANRLADIEPGRERSFLFATALRVASNARRTIGRRGVVVEDGLDDLADAGPNPEEAAEQQRARALLDRVLDALDLELRAVLVLHELEEMTMADIATTLALAPGTVASRLRRARVAFQVEAARLREATR